MIYCPECENGCSAEAEICPKCGHPLKASKTHLKREMRTCDACKEEVRADATKCPHCHSKQYANNRQLGTAQSISVALAIVFLFGVIIWIPFKCVLDGIDAHGKEVEALIISWYEEKAQEKVSQEFP